MRNLNPGLKMKKRKFPENLARLVPGAFARGFLVAGLSFCLAAPLVASDQVPAPKQTHPIALTGATVHMVSGDNLEAATVLFAKGKIVAIGHNLALPDSTQTLDVTGKHIYPGLISANTEIGLVEVSAVRATRDYAETGDINPNVRAEVSFNPDSELLPVTRANGITLALSMPAGGLISGTSALMMLDGWTWEDLTLKAPVALHVNWPDMRLQPERPGGKSRKEQKAALDKKLERLKDAFRQARAYRKARSAEKSGAAIHDSDLRWEAMLPALDKQIPVIVHADDILQIEAAVDWAVAEDIRLVILGGYDAWRVTDLLKEHQVPVVVAGTLRLPERRWEAYDLPFTVPNKLYEAGISFCIASDGGPFESAHERNLPYHAAMAAAYGLPKDEALKAVTLYPAQILGVADQVGSLEKGKDATLIVTDGDPLEIETRVEREFIQGREIDLHSRHTQLYEKYREKYRQLGLIK